MTVRTITGTITLRTPLHVGSGQGNDTVDDLLRRDARGRLIIPGPSLAGALRAIATRLAPRLGGGVCQALQTNPQKGRACGCLTCRLFGDINPQETEGAASGMIIYDAVLTDDPGTVIRDGVGIDRATGAAARKERLKFDLEVLPAGAVFHLRMELDPYFHNDKALQLLAASLTEWRADRGVVGGRVARGLGAFSLEEITFQDETPTDAASLVAFLKQGPDWQGSGRDKSWVTKLTKSARASLSAWPEAKKDIPVARTWLLAEFTLVADGPILINDPVRAAQGGFDHAPLLATYDKNARPVLPGSSLRGVLRSQAERIARTLATRHPEGWEHFKAHCPACNPLTTNTGDPVASCNSFIKGLPAKERRKLDKIGAEDYLCMACRLFGSPWNGSRLRVEDAYLEPGTDPKPKVMDFLAIDRFTGGGREGAKFDAVTLWKPRFRVRLFLENPQPWELGWLALTLRDLHEGLTTVGFGRTKGFGRVQIDSPEVSFGALHKDDWLMLATSEEEKAHALAVWPQQPDFSGLYTVLSYAATQKDDWLKLANDWVKAFHAEIEAHPRHTGFVLQKDSYFDRKAGRYQLSQLYPVEAG
ncbi:MAG: hypothetical protein GXP38_03795 [Chloroflexi bacterium]|nr:hypothetical protein [Chloroflexota bacterium]